MRIEPNVDGRSDPGGARILDLGYQHYTGARLGTWHSFLVMVRGSALRGLGIRRAFRDKVMPWSLIGLTLIPTFALLLIQVITSGALGLTSAYEPIFRNEALFYFLFAGLAAPDLVCADRRMRVVSLYFASPIRRFHYVCAQVVALVSLLCLLTVLPTLLLFIGNALLASSAAKYVTTNAGDLWHLLVGGLLTAVYFGVLALAVAAFTDRRAYASGFFLGLLLVSSVVASIITQVMQFSGNEWFALVDLSALPIHVVGWFFGGAIPSPLTGGAYLIATLAVIVIGFAMLLWRYMEVKD
jgi:ABC-2 type transport system permease protein